MADIVKHTHYSGLREAELARRLSHTDMVQQTRYFVFTVFVFA